MLLDTVVAVDELRRAGIATEVCFDLDWRPDAELAVPCSRHEVTLQGDGDLGERLLRAFRRAGAEGARETVVIGADSPTMPVDRPLRALDALSGGAAAVVGPAPDGGYVLVGAGRACEELFRDIPWGTPDVLDVTRRRAADARILLVEVPGWHDVDRPSDLERLARELEDASVRRRAPATAAWVERFRRSGAS
jgi:glycosyltransferase A (GT-A) superfamily protein (DUF2064 family)